jgi:hypothetical protein
MKRSPSTVQLESEQWTVLSLHQLQLGSKNPAPPIRKKGSTHSLHYVTSHWLRGNSIPKIWLPFFLAWTKSPLFWEHWALPNRSTSLDQ